MKTLAAVATLFASMAAVAAPPTWPSGPLTLTQQGSLAFVNDLENGGQQVPAAAFGTITFDTAGNATGTRFFNWASLGPSQSTFTCRVALDGGDGTGVLACVTIEVFPFTGGQRKLVHEDHFLFITNHKSVKLMFTHAVPPDGSIATIVGVFTGTAE